MTLEVPDLIIPILVLEEAKLGKLKMKKSSMGLVKSHILL